MVEFGHVSAAVRKSSSAPLTLNSGQEVGAFFNEKNSAIRCSINSRNDIELRWWLGTTGKELAFAWWVAA